MKYWEHADPLKCPKGHKMIWLGGVFWICGKGKCNTIFVEEPPYEARRKRMEKHEQSVTQNQAQVGTADAHEIPNATH